MATKAPASQMARHRSARQALGTTHSSITTSRVLMVGAGGIGCELLKNLVLTGFSTIEIVDLDTIDISNLNRQFLFRKQHVKRPKATIARETASRFNPNVDIIAHHKNIKEKEFDVEWYRGFDIVFNALDNLDARRHVNRMCLAANVPLVESGTTGFEGQVQVIKKGLTECYDCNEKPIPKSYPVCTIRSTPSQPVHCIVWAKSFLFSEIFGTSEEQEDGDGHQGRNDFDHSQDAQNAEEIKTLRQESQELKTIRESMGLPDFAKLVFDKVFNRDIERLRSMEDMWKTRTAPIALSYTKVSKPAGTIDPLIYKQDQRVWTQAENVAIFQESLVRLSARLAGLQETAEGDSKVTLEFDKDDPDALDFVSASANLRSLIFGIPLVSKFSIKQIAGNIIPAIATTNAMTAGLCVLQAFKILRQQLNTNSVNGNANRSGKANALGRMIFLTRSADRMIATEPLRPPNPACSVCAQAHGRMAVDPKRATLGDLVDGVLRKKLGYGEDLSVSKGSGLVYDVDFEENLEKKLSELGIGEGETVVVVDDDEERGRVNLSLSVKER